MGNPRKAIEKQWGELSPYLYTQSLISVYLIHRIAGEALPGDDSFLMEIRGVSGAWLLVRRRAVVPPHICTP
jgi:hypothetical protein